MILLGEFQVILMLGLLGQDQGRSTQRSHGNPARKPRKTEFYLSAEDGRSRWHGGVRQDAVLQ